MRPDSAGAHWGAVAGSASLERGGATWALTPLSLRCQSNAPLLLPTARTQWERRAAEGASRCGPRTRTHKSLTHLSGLRVRAQQV